MNTKAFYEITSKRNEVESEIDKILIVINQKRSEAKKYVKGSEIRLRLMTEVKAIEEGIELNVLKSQVKILNYCINKMFYN